MDIQQLKYFVEVARSESYTKAAAQLFVTQPMLTRAIKQMEQELDVKLIERSSKRFYLTDAGQVLYSQAQELILRYDELYQAVEDVRATELGEVRLSTPGVLLDMYCAPLFTQFRQKYPGIDVNISENGSKDIVQSVLSNRADLGLVMLPVEPMDQLDVHVVLRDQVRLMVNREHRLAGRTWVDLKELEGEQIITFGDATTLQEQLVRHCQKHGFTPHIIYKTLMPHFAVQLLSSFPNCVAVLPGPVIQHYGNSQVMSVDLEQHFPWDMAVIRRKHSYQSFASAQLQAFICDFFDHLNRAK